MTVGEAYSPPRDLANKLKRRLTQARIARPATLKFERPALSICFDDFPHSAATLGAAILEKHGVRGTFYAAAGLAGQDAPCGHNFIDGDLERLSRAGHEIGCHTFSHHDCAQAEVYDTLLDLARNRDALAALGHSGALQSLAYPYGETTHALKSALPPRFLCARGINSGLNLGRVDLAQLRAHTLYGDELGAARATLRKAVSRKAWMIAYTHDVAEAPSAWGVTARALDAFIAEAKDTGVMIAPVSHVLTRAMQWANSAS